MSSGHVCLKYSIHDAREKVKITKYNKLSFVYSGVGTDNFAVCGGPTLGYGQMVAFFVFFSPSLSHPWTKKVHGFRVTTKKGHSKAPKFLKQFIY